MKHLSKLLFSSFVLVPFMVSGCTFIALDSVVSSESATSSEPATTSQEGTTSEEITSEETSQGTSHETYVGKYYKDTDIVNVEYIADAGFEEVSYSAAFAYIDKSKTVSELYTGFINIWRGFRYGIEVEYTDEGNGYEPKNPRELTIDTDVSASTIESARFQNVYENPSQEQLATISFYIDHENQVLYVIDSSKTNQAAFNIYGLPIIQTNVGSENYNYVALEEPFNLVSINTYILK